MKREPRELARPSTHGVRSRRLAMSSLTAALVAGLALAPACSVDAPTPITDDNVEASPSGPAEQAREVAPAPQPEARTPVERMPRALAPTSVAGGQIHRTQSTVAAAGQMPTVRTMLQAAKADLPAQLGAFDMADFVVVTDTTTKTLNGDTLYHTTLQQQIAGIPVEGAYLRMTAREDSKAGTSRLASSSFRLYQAPTVATVATVSREDAVKVANERLRAPKGAKLIRQDLLITTLKGELTLAWEIAAADGHFRTLVPASGKLVGQAFVEDMRHNQVSGSSSGDIAVDGAPGSPNATILTVGMPNLDLSSDGGASATTDADGNFTIDATEGETLTAGLSGVASVVTNVSGPNLTATATAAPGASLSFAPVTGEEMAQTTIYKFVDDIRAYLLANGVSEAALGAPLTSNANLASTCNAFYSPFERSINFFSAGSGCNNTAIDTVIVHEFGHFIDDAEGGITNGGLSEGWGDLLACYMLDVAIVGEDFFEDGGIIRTCENDYQFPPDGIDGVHALGQAWAGFGFQIRQGLIAEFGPEAGDEIARSLIIPSLISNAPDIPEAVREVFIRDDDDGDLDNGTVHFDILVAAAENHNLLNFVFPDVVAPDSVNDLAVIGNGATSVSLRWTATGDDGAEGTAFEYDLRFSTSPIDETNFDQATRVAAPTPGPAGTVETTQVSALPGSTLFFAVRVVDDALNLSALSNVVDVTTDEGVVLFDEDVEADTSDWTTTGLWHVTERRAVDGIQSFWYGDEATGNYDTGEANAGTLVSPIISLAGTTDPILVYQELLDVEPGTQFDQVTVIITNTDDPTQTLTLPNPVGNSGGFVQPVISLADFAGANIQITFDFDSVDDFANTTEVWFVDDLQVVASDAPAECAHDLCETGVALDPTCDPCVEQVCAGDSFCCEVEWDDTCVLTAVAVCGLECGPPPPACGDGVCDVGEDCETCPEDCGECGGECVHDECETGDPLDPTCSECAGQVCGFDPFCCDVSWDSLCVGLADEICEGLDCGPTGPECGDASCDVGEDCLTCPADCGECPACEHDVCETGGPLLNGCDFCTPNVCKVDSFCCTFGWDSICVGLVEEHCALTCESSATKPEPRLGAL